MHTQLANRVVLDIETTGLNPNAHEILEIGAFVMDPRLTQGIAYFQSLVLFESHDVLDICYARAQQYCQEMHTQNGLWQDLHNAIDNPVRDGRQIAYPLEALDQALVGFMSTHARPLQIEGKDRPELPIAVGNNVEGFDLRFIENELPNFRKALHYRSLNVSTLRTIGQAYGMQDTRKASSAHRVREDIRDSITLYHQSLAMLRGLPIDG